MASSINADNGVSSGTAGLKSTADNSGVLALQTNGTTAVTVDTSQNVGVGTSSPSTVFHTVGANGTYATNLADTATYAKLRFQNSSGSTLSLFQGVTNSSNPTWYLQAANSNGTSSYDIAISPFGGNVGIGTNSPSYKVDINNASNDVAIRMSRGVQQVLMGLDSTGKYISGPNTDPLYFSVNGSERMRIDSSGNVGIGTNSPGSYGLLAVNGNTYVLGSYALRFNNAANNDAYGIYNSGSSGTSTLAFRYASVDRVNFDASGNVGIGVTPSAWNSALVAMQLGNYGNVYAFKNSGNVYLNNNTYVNSVSNDVYINTAPAGRYRISDNVHIWYNAPSGTAGTIPTFTQAMTLDASGYLLVGQTTVGNTVGAVLGFDGLVRGVKSGTTSATSTMEVYSTGASAYRFFVGMQGQVYCTNTTISGISDARLKENISDLDVGLDAILAIKPRRFDWKEGKGKNIKGDIGFIAQEFEQVFPDMIDEWKDPAPEGEEPYKSVRPELIPVLVKAIQELNAKIDAQAAEIAALKGK